jgi:3-oxoacyl-[acyl-carrier-protein] synthase II
MIEYGDADIMITGGSDSIITEFSVAGFGLLGALSKSNDNPEGASKPFDLKRDGFVLGEGAGILIMEELSHAQARGANILAEITGFGTSSNAYRITDSPPDGRGADQSMRSALQDAGLDPEDIDYINAHGTSTLVNDRSETQAIKKVFGEAAYGTPISSNKSTLGHLIASAGTIELIVSAMTIQKSLIPPTINYEIPDPDCDLDYVPNEPRKHQVDAVLSNSFAFGGQNASLVVERYYDA